MRHLAEVDSEGYREFCTGAGIGAVPYCRGTAIDSPRCSLSLLVAACICTTDCHFLVLGINTKHSGNKKHKEQDFFHNGYNYCLCIPNLCKISTLFVITRYKYVKKYRIPISDANRDAIYIFRNRNQTIKSSSLYLGSVHSSLSTTSSRLSICERISSSIGATVSW